MNRKSQLIAAVFNVVATGLVGFGMISSNFVTPILALILASTGQLFNLDQKKFVKLDLYFLIWAVVIVVLGIILVGMQMVSKQ